MNELMSYREIGPTRGATVDFSDCRTTVAKSTKRRTATVALSLIGKATVAPTQTGVR